MQYPAKIWYDFFWVINMTYGNIVKIRGNSINVYTEGKGSLTLIVMAGMGVTSPVLEYSPLYRKLSDKYKVVVVEKTGYGLSGSAATKRTLENMVGETREALRLSGIEPPYVLVPHSYSGFEAVWWANKYPQEIKAILGIDMVSPDVALLEAKETPYKKKVRMLNKQKEKFKAIAKKTFLSKLSISKTLNSSGILSGDWLNDEEKELYEKLFYKNLCNYEYQEEAMLMTDNAEIAYNTGVPKCPSCFFISDMKSNIKAMTWQESSIAYANKCGGEYHLSDSNRVLYTEIPDKMADTFKKFLAKLSEPKETVNNSKVGKQIA